MGANIPSNAQTVPRINAAVQIGGGLLLATGKLPRMASAALALSAVPGSLAGHAFWNEGKPSLGWRGRRAVRKVSEAVATALRAGAERERAPEANVHLN